MIRLNIEKVEQLRKKKKMTQEELARKGRIGLRGYSNIVRGEVGNVNLKTIGGICNALGCRPSNIIEYEPDPAG